MHKHQVKTVFIILLLSLLPVSLFAQETVFDRYPVALGVGVGNLSGAGMSYQHWFGGWGYQVAGGFSAYPLMTYGNDPFMYNAGLEFQYPLYTDAFWDWIAGRLYLFVGVRHWGYIEAVETAPSSGVYTASPFTVELAAGGGVGSELVLFDHFAAVAEIVYIVIWKSGKNGLQESITMETYPQLSLRYRFN